MDELNHRLPPDPGAGPLLVVLSGPSGVGKDAVLAHLRESGFPLHYITTVTTRPRREGERDGVDYRFLSLEEYRRLQETGGLLESANVYGNWYGVPRQPVVDALVRGEDVILKIDVQGAATIRRLVPEAVFIFLVAPSEEELAERLRARLTESAEELALRLRTAAEEMKHLPEFDYRVENRRGALDRAVEAIRAIIMAEKCRVHPRRIRLP